MLKWFTSGCVNVSFMTVATKGLSPQLVQHASTKGKGVATVFVESWSCSMQSDIW